MAVGVYVELAKVVDLLCGYLKGGVWRGADAYGGSAVVDTACHKRTAIPSGYIACADTSYLGVGFAESVGPVVGSGPVTYIG